MRRPFPGSDIVNTAMFQLIYFAPIVFALGNLTWSNFLADGSPKEALVPNLISLGFGVVILLLPYKIIFAYLFEGTYPDLLKYEDNKIYLSSEYDRLNPSTSSEAIEAYI